MYLSVALLRGRFFYCDTIQRATAKCSDSLYYTSGCALVPTASRRTAAPCAAGASLLQYQKAALAFSRSDFWYSRRESNPQRPLRRGLLYPFNYGSICIAVISFILAVHKNEIILQHFAKKSKEFCGHQSAKFLL